MIKAEYKRDMQHNYLVIHDEIQMDAGYQEKMLYYNKMIGFLPFHIQYMNGERLLSYEVHGYQSLVEVCNHFPFKVQQLKQMIENLFETIFQVGEYLLKEDDLLISLDYMFVHLPSYKLSLCYYAGYQVPIKKQLASFFERLMTCVDYEDKEAVYLIYTLYMKSKEINVTVEDFIHVLKQNLEEDQNIKKEELEVPKKAEFEVPKKEEFVGPKAVQAAYEPPNKTVESPSQMRSYMETKGVVPSRPLISKPRQDEQEVLSYPPKCYILAVVILLVAVLVSGVIISTGVLMDDVTKQLEPIKIVGMLLIVCLPAGYGILHLFQPQNKVIKEVKTGLYEPMVHHEMAAAVEIPVYEGGLNLHNNKFDAQYKRISNHNNPMDYEIKTAKRNQELENPEKTFKEGERHTTLLQKGNEIGFPQLVSELLEVAETILIQECPFFIGTAKNRLNYSLTSPVISRYHAKIEELEGTYFLCDLSSTNGTFLNGRRLAPEEPNVLIPGDKISFANINFIFTCPN